MHFFREKIASRLYQHKTNHQSYMIDPLLCQTKVKVVAKVDVDKAAVMAIEVEEEHEAA